MLFIDRDKIESILILMPDKHMGNVVVSIPAILSLQNYFKDKVKGIVVDESYQEIMQAFFQEKIILPYSLRKNRSGIFLIKHFLSFMKKMRKIDSDVSIDFEGRTTGAVLSFLSGAKYRIGFKNGNKSYYYNVKIFPYGYVHKSEYYLSIPQKLGIPFKNKIKPKLKDEWEKSLYNKLFKAGITEYEKIICIHPGAGKIYKKWPAQNFAKVADYLAKKGFCVILIGSDKDKNDIFNVMSFMKNKAIRFGNELSLGELMSLFKITKLYIGNDSGPMHLASLFNIPIIAIFGPADDKRWKPFGNRIVVLRGADRCIKCKGKDCNLNFRCINLISVDKVIESANKILKVI